MLCDKNTSSEWPLFFCYYENNQNSLFNGAEGLLQDQPWTPMPCVNENPMIIQVVDFLCIGVHDIQTIILNLKVFYLLKLL